jgi:DNA-binding HxlR family transcriptional regulator
MRWDDIHEMPCSVARALSVVGDRWTSLIVRDAFLGVRRFEQFQKSLGIPRHRLADRLQRLVQEEVLERREYQAHPPRCEYRLTAKGKDLYPVILALLLWGNRWMPTEGGPPIRHRHRSCGHLVQPRFVCPECQEPIQPRDMEVVPARPRPLGTEARQRNRAAKDRRSGP